MFFIDFHYLLISLISIQISCLYSPDRVMGMLVVSGQAKHMDVIGTRLTHLKTLNGMMLQLLLTERGCTQ